MNVLWWKTKSFQFYEDIIFNLVHKRPQAMCMLSIKKYTQGQCNLADEHSFTHFCDGGRKTPNNGYFPITF